MSKIEWSSIFELILLCITVGVYPLLLVLAMVYMGNFYGAVGAWGICGVLLSPLVGAWYYVLSRRRRRFEELLEAKPTGFRWNIDKSTEEYLGLVRKQKKGKREEE